MAANMQGIRGNGRFILFISITTWCRATMTASEHGEYLYQVHIPKASRMPLVDVLPSSIMNISKGFGEKSSKNCANHP